MGWIASAITLLGMLIMTVLYFRANWNLAQAVQHQQRHIRILHEWLEYLTFGPSAEAGRRLASLREDMIADGMDPADLPPIPHPDDPPRSDT